MAATNDNDVPKPPSEVGEIETLQQLEALQDKLLEQIINSRKEKSAHKGPIKVGGDMYFQPPKNENPGLLGMDKENSIVYRRLDHSPDREKYFSARDSTRASPGFVESSGIPKSLTFHVERPSLRGGYPSPSQHVSPRSFVAQSEPGHGSRPVHCVTEDTSLTQLPKELAQIPSDLLFDPQEQSKGVPFSDSNHMLSGGPTAEEIGRYDIKEEMRPCSFQGPSGSPSRVPRSPPYAPRQPSGSPVKSYTTSVVRSPGGLYNNRYSKDVQSAHIRSQEYVQSSGDTRTLQRKLQEVWAELESSCEVNRDLHDRNEVLNIHLQDSSEEVAVLRAEVRRMQIELQKCRSTIGQLEDNFRQRHCRQNRDHNMSSHPSLWTAENPSERGWETPVGDVGKRQQRSLPHHHTAPQPRGPPVARGTAKIEELTPLRSPGPATGPSGDAPLSSSLPVGRRKWLESSDAGLITGVPSYRIDSPQTNSRQTSSHSGKYQSVDITSDAGTFSGGHHQQTPDSTPLTVRAAHLQSSPKPSFNLSEPHANSSYQQRPPEPPSIAFQSPPQQGHFVSPVVPLTDTSLLRSSSSGKNLTSPQHYRNPSPADGNFYPSRSPYDRDHVAPYQPSSNYAPMPSPSSNHLLNQSIPNHSSSPTYRVDVSPPMLPSSHHRHNTSAADRTEDALEAMRSGRVFGEGVWHTAGNHHHIQSITLPYGADSGTEAVKTSTISLQSLEERVKMQLKEVAEAEKRFAQLQIEKQHLESVLSRIPRRMTIQLKKTRVNTEERLDEVDREIGRVRMVLRNHKAL